MVTEIFDVKLNPLLSVMLLLVGYVLVIYAVPVFAAHTSTADLEPEWSAAGQFVDYTVTITNNGPDTVDEVRIYKNEKSPIVFAVPPISSI